MVRRLFDSSHTRHKSRERQQKTTKSKQSPFLSAYNMGGHDSRRGGRGEWNDPPRVPWKARSFFFFCEGLKLGHYCCRHQSSSRNTSLLTLPAFSALAYSAFVRISYFPPCKETHHITHMCKYKDAFWLATRVMHISYVNRGGFGFRPVVRWSCKRHDIQTPIQESTIYIQDQLAKHRGPMYGSIPLVIS